MKKIPLITNILLAFAVLLFSLAATAQEVAPVPASSQSTPAVNTVQQAPDSTMANKQVQNNSQTVNQISAAQSIPAAQTTPVTPFYQNANNAAPPIGSGAHLLNVTLGLMAIIGLIFALSWFVKRFTQGAMSGNSHIKMLSAMPLGTRERVVLLEVGTEQLLIGVTATTINTLHVLKTPIVVAEKTDITSEFSKKLMAVLQQKNTAEITAGHSSHNNNTPNTAG